MSDSTLEITSSPKENSFEVPFIFELIAIFSLIEFLNPANDTIFLASVGLLVFDALIVHNKGV